jgi:hypothetical protein
MRLPCAAIEIITWFLAAGTPWGGLHDPPDGGSGSCVLLMYRAMRVTSCGTHLCDCCEQNDLLTIYLGRTKTNLIGQWAAVPVSFAPSRLQECHRSTRASFLSSSHLCTTHTATSRPPVWKQESACSSVSYSTGEHARIAPGKPNAPQDRNPKFTHLESSFGDDLDIQLRARYLFLVVQGVATTTRTRHGLFLVRWRVFFTHHRTNFSPPA